MIAIEFLKDRLGFSGKLIYRSDEFSLDTLDKPAGGTSSLLVNDIQIECSEEGEMMFVWGLCPHSSWREGTVHVPDRELGVLRLTEQLLPGTSKRITASTERWPVVFDPSNGWLRIGLDDDPDQFVVEFADGCVAALDGRGLTRLWLRPEILP
ncbi:hypothetical protein [Luteibacter sp. CQ10]|uniref:hypothetical protein n=1 Tax=Luteibacter sp. CQ10 TaxID=2805821 RepID=UPI0034A51459